MEARRKILVAKIGSDYTPPVIRAVPPIADGMATVHFRSPLTKGQRGSLRVCFRNFCTRHQVNPCMTVREQSLTIRGLTEDMLREALDFLEVNTVPEPRTLARITPQQAKAPSHTPKQCHGAGLDLKSQLARASA